MTRTLFSGGCALVVCAALAAAQAPAPNAPKPDSPEIRQRIDALRKTAGAEWGEAVDFICALDPNRANRPDDPELEPTRVFDNLAVIGRTGTAVWVVTTTAGLVLIDAGYADQLDSVLLKGMKTLGLDPARVTHVIVGHGHGDHFGGAPVLSAAGRARGDGRTGLGTCSKRRLPRAAAARRAGHRLLCQSATSPSRTDRR